MGMMGQGYRSLLVVLVAAAAMFGLLRVWLSTSKTLGVLLGFSSSFFTLLSILFVFPEVRVYTTWPSVDGVVLAARVIPEPGAGSAMVRFGYMNGPTGRTVVAGPLFFPSAARREKFAADYVVGSHHMIRPNPDPLGVPQVALGITREFLSVPVAMLLFAAGLFVAARYFWRADDRAGPTDPEVPSDSPPGEHPESIAVESPAVSPLEPPAASPLEPPASGLVE